MFKNKATMKKTYMTPTMEVVKMQVNQMICLSAGLNSGSTPITNPSDFGAHEDDGYEDW